MNGDSDQIVDLTTYEKVICHIDSKKMVGG